MESDFNKERSKYKETDVEIDFSTTNWRHRLLWAIKILFGAKVKVKKRVKLV